MTPSALLQTLDLNTLEGIGDAVAPQDALVLMYVHVLPSLELLISRLIELGFDRRQIFVAGKGYSTVPKARHDIERLGVEVLTERSEDFTPGFYDHVTVTHLDRACDRVGRYAVGLGVSRVILVDDGGLLSEAWHRAVGDGGPHVISVQQTASGMNGRHRRFAASPYVKVDVARSAAKSYFESRIIARGTFRAASNLGALDGASRVGILGLGRIGRSLVARLAHRFAVSGYDTLRGQGAGLGIPQHACARDLIQNSDIIFGCTGENSVELTDLPADGHRMFVSCSSRDVEFRALLRAGCVDEGRGDPPFGEMEVRVGKLSCTVLNGGFPINFDRRREWETTEEISLTRALILVGILQALRADPDQPRDAWPLDAETQRRLTTQWMDMIGEDSVFFGVYPNEFSDPTWWVRRSSRQRPY